MNPEFIVKGMIGLLSTAVVGGGIWVGDISNKVYNNQQEAERSQDTREILIEVRTNQQHILAEIQKLHEEIDSK